MVDTIGAAKTLRGAAWNKVGLVLGLAFFVVSTLVAIWNIQALRQSDEAVRQRLKACQPWVKALLDQMLPAVVRHGLPSELRFQVIDGSTVPGPGAQGIVTHTIS